MQRGSGRGLLETREASVSNKPHASLAHVAGISSPPMRCAILTTGEA